MENDPKQKPNPFENPLFRREAGEGWFAGGISKNLLGAIVAREVLADELTNSYGEEREAVLVEYQAQTEFIRELKEELGIGDPPPRLER